MPHHRPRPDVESRPVAPLVARRGPKSSRMFTAVVFPAPMLPSMTKMHGVERGRRGSSSRAAAATRAPPTPGPTGLGALPCSFGGEGSRSAPAYNRRPGSVQRCPESHVETGQRGDNQPPAVFWAGPTLSRVPCGREPAKGQPQGPRWRRRASATAGADANFLLLAPPSGPSLRDSCTIRSKKHQRVRATAGDVCSPAQDQGAAISAAAHPSEAPGTAPKTYILTS